MASRLFRGVACAALCLLFSCSPRVGSAEAGRAVKLRAETLSIAKADGTSVPLLAEIAADDADRERGLMHRKEVPEGEGMLFVFDSDRRLSFWMKNTLVPLSIAFVASDGRILEIKDMKPLSLAPVESVRSVRFALEVPGGWFSRSGVAVGDVLGIPPAYRSAR
jgi:hypothetical protein